MKSLFLILLLPFATFARIDELPLSRFEKGQLAPMLLNKPELELMSVKRTKVIQGVQFERDIDIESAKAKGGIVCSFENYPQKLKDRPYKLTYSRYWAEGEANYISFSTGSEYFSIVCHKHESEVTLAELNQAFIGLLEFASVEQFDTARTAPSHP